MMHGEASPTLERFGTALADPIRRQVLLVLLEAGSYPTEMLERIDTSQPNLSNHLACLRGCGLVRTAREGRRVRYELASAALAQALQGLVDVDLQHAVHDHLGVRS